MDQIELTKLIEALPEEIRVMRKVMQTPFGELLSPIAEITNGAKSEELGDKIREMIAKTSYSNGEAVMALGSILIQLLVDAEKMLEDCDCENCKAKRGEFPDGAPKVASTEGLKSWLRRNL